LYTKSRYVNDTYILKIHGIL